METPTRPVVFEADAVGGRDSAVETAQDVEHLRVDLGRLVAEAQRLGANCHRFRAELRRARPAAAVVAALLSARHAPVNAKASGSSASVGIDAAAHQWAEDEAFALLGLARQNRGGEAASGAGIAGAASRPGHVSLRELQLARECLELRRWIAELESVDSPQARCSPMVNSCSASSASGAPDGPRALSWQDAPVLSASTARPQRAELRHERQIGRLTEQLHEQVKRSGTSCSSSAGGSPDQARSVRSMRSVGTSASAAFSQGSVELDRQLELFYKRFALRQGSLGLGRASGS